MSKKVKIIIVGLLLVLAGCSKQENVELSAKSFANHIKNTLTQFKDLEVGKLTLGKTAEIYQSYASVYQDIDEESLKAKGYSVHEINEIKITKQLVEQLATSFSQNDGLVEGAFLGKVENGSAKDSLYVYYFANGVPFTQDDINQSQLKSKFGNNLIVHDKFLIDIYDKTLEAYQISHEEFESMIKMLK